MRLLERVNNMKDSIFVRFNEILALINEHQELILRTMSIHKEKTYTLTEVYDLYDDLVEYIVQELEINVDTLKGEE